MPIDINKIPTSLLRLKVSLRNKIENTNKKINPTLIIIG